jgi:ribonuclease T2
MRAVFGIVGVVIVLAAGLVLSREGSVESTREGYLLLAVSWTPSWCEAEGRARGDDRCDPGSDAGWLVHGLWPQNDDGTWPEFCDSPHENPSRAMTRAMEDVMGSSGLAAYQWRKHGSCSGLSPEGYFSATRAAFEALRLPEIGGTVRLDQVLAQVQQANPAIGADMAVATCQGGMLREVRVCLSHDLTPQPCDPEVLARQCRSARVQAPTLD